MKIFYKYTGLIGDRKESTALITHSKLLTATSTYRGGEETYMNYLEFRLWKMRLHYAWPSEEHPNE